MFGLRIKKEVCERLCAKFKRYGTLGLSTIFSVNLVIVARCAFIFSMSNNLSNVGNEVFGALKERAQLATSYFNDVERAIVKATNRDLVVPKSKHVKSLSNQNSAH